MKGRTARPERTGKALDNVWNRMVVSVKKE